MKIGILCGEDIEIQPFLSQIEGCTVTERAMLRIYEGTINSVPTALLMSGICRVDTAVAAQILISCYHVDAIISAGIAFGMDKRIRVFDTVISTEAVYYGIAENSLTNLSPQMGSVFFPADEELLVLSRAAARKLTGFETVMQSEKTRTDEADRMIGKQNRKPCIFWGRMATGEGLFRLAGKKEIKAEYALLSADTKTANAAHVCYVNRTPFLAIRTIVDTGEHSGTDASALNYRWASGTARDITVAVLSELKEYLSDELW